MLLGGDPQGGVAGAGYEIAAEGGPPNGLYRRGTLGLCASIDRKCSSQFFITLDDFETQDFYPVLGTMRDGHDTLKRLQFWGSTATEEPSPPVAIQKLEIVTER